MNYVGEEEEEEEEEYDNNDNDDNGNDDYAAADDDNDHDDVDHGHADDENDDDKSEYEDDNDMPCVQVVIDAQWLITVPPEAVRVVTNSGKEAWICNHYTFQVPLIFTLRA